MPVNFVLIGKPVEDGIENVPCQQPAGEKPPVQADKARECKQIGNAWRYYDTDSERVYRSDLFSQYEKEGIEVKADADKNKISAKASLSTLCSRITADAVIDLDFAANLDKVRAKLDDDRELIIIVPKKITTVSVE